MQVRVGLDFVLAGEQYRLELPVADARTLRRECGQPDRAPARARRRAGAAADDDAGVQVAGGRTIRLFKREFPTGWGTWDVEASLKPEVSATVGGSAPDAGGDGSPAPAAGAPAAEAPSPATSVSVNQGPDGAQISAQHQGLIRDWLAHDLDAVTDQFELRGDRNGVHFTAGVRTATQHFGPFDVQFGFDAIRLERDEDGRGPYRFHAPQLNATVTMPVQGLPGVSANVELAIAWTPPWQRIGQWIARQFAGEAAATGVGAGTTAAAGSGAGTAATAGEGAVTAAELAEAGVATGAAVPVAAAVGAVVVSLAWIGGVLYTVAQAAEEGRQDGLKTWYVREFAVQFGDSLFGNYGQHVHGADAVPGAQEMAGRGRADARRAVHDLGEADRARLRSYGRTAVVRAMARQIADRVGSDISYDDVR